MRGKTVRLLQRIAKATGRKKEELKQLWKTTPRNKKEELKNKLRNESK